MSGGPERMHSNGQPTTLGPGGSTTATVGALQAKPIGLARLVPAQQPIGSGPRGSPAELAAPSGKMHIASRDKMLRA